MIATRLSIFTFMRAKLERIIDRENIDLHFFNDAHLQLGNFMLMNKGGILSKCPGTAHPK